MISKDVSSLWVASPIPKSLILLTFQQARLVSSVFKPYPVNVFLNHLGIFDGKRFPYEIRITENTYLLWTFRLDQTFLIPEVVLLPKPTFEFLNLNDTKKSQFFALTWILVCDF